ncbi:AmmeMemoRadiSam system radical SAM enzyme [Methanimicrococcus blatticola]|uniref:Pyruvate formate lyase activating enzyme n=1 Tax=Methanimicrococcus blatticola TaxID=91560 RepID=A0A484F5J4_9EURY|nr:AmmeMemoRadiSam system radical SAM enzyme [Methanimicrococcus blatticola]MBZ3934970.1 AmmeMemoRadiSam system radical SAM enzyme [Methanimicrococcus blatticola]MCC2508931.1 AmmeMemoRadiSam system radical SAM enzyme [Methanimicrococcus blatticola]TDQ71040.1 pyruvate formate lyase activating enzyme [Methanimicrococcus blatticola]
MVSGLKEAMLFETLLSGDVRCGVCARRCTIAPDKTGFCRVRKNVGGTLYALNYGYISSEAIDPIEKKPLYHFLPGTTTYSLGTFGCNFHCRHCQNHAISMPDESVYKAMFSDLGLSRFGEVVTPDEVIQRALLLDTKSISFTYNEPAVWFEFVYDTAVLAKENGLSVILVTNGYMTPEALEKLAPYVDAYRVDLKSFTENFYSEICSAHLNPVLESILKAKELGLYIEIVTLIIPGQNDGIEEAESAASWIIQNLGAETPVHLNAFLPHHQMEDIKSTSSAILERLRSIYMNVGLNYVYIGNTISDFQNTYCPECRSLLINRIYSFGESTADLDRIGDEFRCGRCGRIISLICPNDIDF